MGPLVRPESPARRSGRVSGRRVYPSKSVPTSARSVVEEFIERSAAILHIDIADLASSSRQHHVVEPRRLIVTLGRERWARSTKNLASARQNSSDTLTYIQREGVRPSLEDEELLRRYENLDEELAGGRP